MKTSFWIEVKEQTDTKTTLPETEETIVSEENVSQNFYGRTYNEDVPFTQANFQAYQDILNKRNELLGSVKHTYAV